MCSPLRRAKSAYVMGLADIENSTAPPGLQTSSVPRLHKLMKHLHKPKSSHVPDLHGPNTVRSDAEERTFSGARLGVLIFRLRSYRVLIFSTADFNGHNIRETLMFLGQAGMFLSFQDRRSSATRSSTSDLTVIRFTQLPQAKLIR